MSIVARGLGLGAAAIIVTVGLGLSQQAEQPAQQIGGGAFAAQRTHQVQRQKALPTSRQTEVDATRESAGNGDPLEALARKMIAARESASPMSTKGEYDVRRIIMTAMGQNAVKLTAETEDEVAALLFAAIMMMDD